MADPQMPRNPSPADRPPEETPRKHRKRGYRGYPSNPSSGDVHGGTGFGGAGSVNPGGNPADRGIISERTRQDVGED